jgi:hypothetical protein
MGYAKQLRAEVVFVDEIPSLAIEKVDRNILNSWSVMKL